MKDANNREIEVGDVVLYGYKFYCSPKLGLVTDIYKNGFRFKYGAKHWQTKEDIITESVCKRPDFAVVVTPAIKDRQLRDLLHFPDELLKECRVKYYEDERENS